MLKDNFGQVSTYSQNVAFGDYARPAGGQPPRASLRSPAPPRRSNSLRGHGGQRHTPYNLRTNELRLHVKFESPRLTGLAVHRKQTEVETKRGLTNICLDETFIVFCFQF